MADATNEVRLWRHDHAWREYVLIDGDEYIARPRAEYDALVKERDGATARADAASARLARAEALLREARDLMDYVGCQDCLADNPMLTGQWDRAKDRIDALLGEAPGDDDRKGEDGAAVQAATTQTPP